MSFVQTSLQVLPAANDATTFYVAMQPSASGKTYEKFVSPDLTFNPKTNQFALNGKPISKNKVTTSATAPLNPNVGDIWYDNTLDVSFRYTFDGENYYWVDISSSALPTNFNPNVVSATANTTITSVSGVLGTAIASFNPFNSVTKGIAPYTYYVSSGTLPAGISIDPTTGIVSGTPIAAQSLSNVVFSVKDATNTTASTTNTIGFSISAVIQFLIVGGGGGGGYASGNGNAGGGGAGGVVVGNITITSGVTYSVSVGAGGAAGTIGCSKYWGCSGNPSTLSSPTITTITAFGGGAGGSVPNSQNYGRPGGSGGGSGYGPPYNPACNVNGGTASQPATPPGGGTGYGYPGGPGPSAGSGGGAGAAGTRLGAGGNGYTWPYTGLKYAFGGGTVAQPGGNGPGGGGCGSPPNGNGQPGVDGRGSGGGAGISSNGGNGGKGTVVLAIPTPSFSGTAPGATVTTPPAAPGYTVLVYTTPGSYTA